MVDRKHLIELIPWYLNGTLKGKELEDVVDFILNDPEGRAALAEWRQVQHVIHTEERRAPPTRVEVRIFDRIRSQSFTQLGIFHPYAIGLSLVVLALLWAIFRPGVILQWRILDDQITSFRIYRSEADGSKYQLLDEIPVNSPAPCCSYIDLFIWPLKEYIYYVEGVKVVESTGIGQIITNSALIALPGQIALISASFIVGYGIVLLIRYRQLLLIGKIRPAAI